jgi:outer membrane protein assembly factor BamE (lipoprotein component of BamABCDE complex)
MSKFRKNNYSPVRIFLIIVFFSTNGCAINLAVLGKQPEGGPFISKSAVGALNSEMSTREQVRECLGEPEFRDVNESYYAYWKTNTESRTTVTLVGFLWYLLPLPLPDRVRYDQVVGFRFDSTGRVVEVKEKWYWSGRTGRISDIWSQPSRDPLWVASWMNDK